MRRREFIRLVTGAAALHPIASYAQRMRLCRASQENEMNSFLKSATAIGGLALSCVPTAAGNDDVQFYNSPVAAAAKLPFSQAVRVGDVLYMSGAIGVLPGKMELAPGGIEPEAKQMIENIGEALKANGLTFDDVFKCTAMLADMSK